MNKWLLKLKYQFLLLKRRRTMKPEHKGLNFLIPMALFLLAVPLLFYSCGGGGGGSSSSGDNTNDGGNITTGSYVVLAWNDLGMHCLNPTYDQLVILPPYNTVFAQVIQRGNPPQIVTTGITVDYAIVNNTYSYGKLFYGQFWDNIVALFGAGAATLPHNYGLNLFDANIHNTLSGTMEMVNDHFQVNGIPLTPVEDGTTTKNPFQVAQITVKDANGNTLVTTQATAPTSDEINCGKCHAPGGTLTDVFNDIAAVHDRDRGTAFVASITSGTPILCATTCHGSPALGGAVGARGTSGKYLSEAIHTFHANRQTPTGAAIACYDCHPGATTQCNRSLAHTASDGNCVTCHDTMTNMAASITANTKVPWVNEPACATCHSGVAEVATGTTLYRNANTGHGGVYCAACHQSPHAMIPSRVASDNYQALQYQAKDVSIGDCRNCHSTSRGGGTSISDFVQVHAGTNPEEQSACNVCHTALPAGISTTDFPHQFQWKTRS
jgi:hypothetical protein